MRLSKFLKSKSSGRSERLTPYFDAAYYAKNNPDIDARRDLLKHFMDVGWKEGRDPCAWFSTTAYLAEYPDVYRAGVNPFLHNIESGTNEKRSPSPGGGAITELPNFGSRRPAGVLGDRDLAAEALTKEGAYSTAPPRTSSIEDYRGSTRAAVSHPVSRTEKEKRDFLKLCDQFGVNRDIVDWFDSQYYYLTHRSAYQIVASPEPISCFEHFLHVGLHVGLSVSHDLKFDYEFYAEHLAELDNNLSPRVTARPSSTKTLYLHWLNIGLPIGFPGDMAQWLYQQIGAYSVDTTLLDLETYQRLIPGGSELSQRQLIKRIFLEIERGECRMTPSPENAFVFAGIADRLAIAGQEEGAARLYDQVAHSLGDRNRWACRHNADSLFRRSRFLYASALYRTDIEEGSGNAWSFINLARCYQRLGDHRRAFEVLAEAVQRFPGDIPIEQQFVESEDQYFVHEWELSKAIATAGRIDEAASRLSAVLDKITPRDISIAAPRPIRRIALLVNENIAQCTMYRVDQKHEYLTDMGYHVERFNYTMDTERLRNRLGCFEALIIYRTPAFPNELRTIVAARELGLITIYDLDDLVFGGADLEGFYERSASLIGSDRYAEIVLSGTLFEHALSLCDYGMASTDALADRMSRALRGRSVFVQRNGLHSAHDLKARRGFNGRETVTIFYGTASLAHSYDIQTILIPAFRKLFSRHQGKVRLFLVGPRSVFGDLQEFGDAVVHRDLVGSFADYMSLMAEVADINVSCLHPCSVTECKSEIKWMEAAVLGVPSVVISTQTYRDIVEHQVTGLLCNDCEDFFENLDLLVTDQQLRTTIGEKARQYVSVHYSSENMIHSYRSMLAKISPPCNPRRRILIVNVLYAPQTYGGATRVVHDNVREISTRYRDDFEIEVFCTVQGGPEPYLTRYYTSDGIRVTGVTTELDPFHDSRLRDEKMGRIFEDHLRGRRPDIIHFHCVQRLTVSVVEAAVKMNIPYIITIHDGFWASPYLFFIDDLDQMQVFNFRTPERPFLEHFAINQPICDPSTEVGQEYMARASQRNRVCGDALRGASRLLVISQQIGDIYRQAGSPDFVVVENGVSALPSVNRSRNKTGKARVGHLSGMSRIKGLHLVKYAFLSGSFANITFTYVDLSKPEDFRSDEVWGSTRVTIIGRIAQSNISSLYEQLDVVILPSVWPEGYGLVTREALACGCWVVASNRGAVGDPVIEGENGFVVDIGSIDPLANVLRAINDDPERYCRSPAVTVPLRTSAEQADDIACVYFDVLQSSPRSFNSPSDGYGS